MDYYLEPPIAWVVLGDYHGSAVASGRTCGVISSVSSSQEVYFNLDPAPEGSRDVDGDGVQFRHEEIPSSHHD